MARTKANPSIAFFFLLIGIACIEAQVGPWYQTPSSDIPQLIIWLNGSNLSAMLNTVPVFVLQIITSFQRHAYFGIDYVIWAVLQLGKSKKKRICHIDANRPDKGKLQVHFVKCYDFKPAEHSSTSCTSSSKKKTKKTKAKHHAKSTSACRD